MGLRLSHGLMGRATGPKPVAVLRERRVPAALQDLQNRLLDQSIQHSGNAPSTLPFHPNPLRDSSPSPIPIIRSADRRSRSSGSAGGSIPISSSDSLTGTMPPSP